VAKLVFCEDDPTIQKLIQVALRTSGHELYVASNGTECLSLIEKVLPNIVFSDVSMPDMDGMQLCAVLKDRSNLSHIPVILMTASVQRLQVEEGYRHGARGYLMKPFSMPELRAKIEEYLSPADAGGA
jgi:CheY-like chemotaxis protein